MQQHPSNILCTQTQTQTYKTPYHYLALQNLTLHLRGDRLKCTKNTTCVSKFAPVKLIFLCAQNLHRLGLCIRRKNFSAYIPLAPNTSKPNTMCSPLLKSYIPRHKKRQTQNKSIPTLCVQKDCL